MIALQPVSPAVFVQTAVENQKIANGLERFDAAFHKRIRGFAPDAERGQVRYMSGETIVLERYGSTTAGEFGAVER